MVKYYVDDVFVITRCKYDKTKNTKQQRADIVENIRKKLGSNIRVGYCDILILWDNLPKQNYLENCLGYSEKVIITKFCERIKKEEHPKLYITSPLIFTDEKNPNMADILETVLLIWKTADLIPNFMEKNFIDYTDLEIIEDEEREKASKKFLSQHNHDTVEEMFADEGDMIELEYAEYMADCEEEIQKEVSKERRIRFERFFSVVDSLLDTLNRSNKVDEEVNFIDLYYRWQKEEVSGEYCLRQLQDISRASWYRYVNNFEESPIYEEVSITYIEGLVDHRKKGILPDTFLFLNQFKKDNIENEKLRRDGWAVFDINGWNCYLQFDEIHSLIDIRRCLDSCIYKKNILKHKGFLADKLKEYNFTEEDVFVHTEI